MNPDPNPQIVCFTEFQLSSEYAGQLVIRPVQRFRSICKIFNLHLYVTKFPGVFWWKLFIWFFMRICNSLNSEIEWKKITNEEYVNFVLKSNFLQTWRALTWIRPWSWSIPNKSCPTKSPEEVKQKSSIGQVASSEAEMKPLGFPSQKLLKYLLHRPTRMWFWRKWKCYSLSWRPPWLKPKSYLVSTVRNNAVGARQQFPNGVKFEIDGRFYVKPHFLRVLRKFAVVDKSQICWLWVTSINSR